MNPSSARLLQVKVALQNNVKLAWVVQLGHLEVRHQLRNLLHVVVGEVVVVDCDVVGEVVVVDCDVVGVVVVVVEVNVHNTTTYQVVYTVLAVVEHLGDQNQKAARAAIDPWIVENMV